MKSTKNISFPYPVLGIKGDFLEGAFTVAIDCVFEELEFVFKATEIEVSNAYIAELRQEGTVFVHHKITCPTTFSVFLVREYEELRISSEEISNKLSVESYLVTADLYKNYWHDSFNEDYRIARGEIGYTLQPNSIIGLTAVREVTLDKTYSEGVKSMFKFSRAPEEKNFLNVSLHDNYIEIHYPKERGETGLNIIKVLPGQRKYTFLSEIIVPALVVGFEAMYGCSEEGFEEFKDENSWARSLDGLLSGWRALDSSLAAAQMVLEGLINRDEGDDLPLIVRALNEVI